MEAIQGHGNFIEVEGAPIPWSGETASTDEIRAAAGWDADVEILLDGEGEREVHPGERFDLRHRPRFKRKVVLILVNHQEVRIRRRVATGLQIKQEAIAQGVAIRVDFVLFKVSGDALQPIKDDQRVHLHERDEFRCVAGDDNS